ncbi:MAG: U32 family peptidase [Lachnospiraceae bacterium]|nr:U32 family peptidase [Lachnospiraceae bacterium]
MQSLELLAPAGSLETLKAVICAGADAVYLGGTMFGARAYANNFTKEELLEGIAYGHIHGRKIFLAVNTLLKEQELETELYDYLCPFYEAGIDGVIVQDMGVVDFIFQHFPGLPIHSSTQMTVADKEGARLLKEAGISRVVTAREMSLSEIRQIHDEVGVEIESFIHGALCYCYSGQCLMSSMLGGRSGNRGRCAQPCRLPYQVNGGKETPILSLKDLCTLPFLYELADNGVYSFKIEGRMKSPEYAAGVVSIYRKYMDSYLDGTRRPVDPNDRKLLEDLGNRSGFTEGYYYKHNDSKMLSGTTSSHSKRETPEIEEIRKRYISGQLQEKIYGKLILTKDLPAILTVWNDSCQVTVEGEVVQQAMKQPLTEEKLVEKLEKTGNTPFAFEQLQVELEPDVFLPVNQINQLRRDALEQLEQKILAPYQRKNSKPLDLVSETKYDSPMQGGIRYAVSVEQRNQLEVVAFRKGISDVYLDSMLYQRESLLTDLAADITKLHDYGKRAYYIMPAVFRSHTRSFYESIWEKMEQIGLDGYVVCSLDELSFLTISHPTKKMLIGDSRLYTFSNRAADWFYRNGIIRDTIPLELNKKEVMRRDNHCSEMIIYGRAPLMVSAGCVHKNTSCCDRRMQLTKLTDRYHVDFPVRNVCAECYNILYNSTPLCLWKEKETLARIHCNGYRICFTVEDAAQTEDVLKYLLDQEGVAPEDYTNGHWKRGVE